MGNPELWKLSPQSEAPTGYISSLAHSSKLFRRPKNHLVSFTNTTALLLGSIFCISSFAYCCDKGQLRKEGVDFRLQFEDTVLTDTDSMEEGAAMLCEGRCRPCCIHSEEAESRECWCSTHFLLFLLQAMGWCRPYSGKLFPAQLNLSGSTLTDTLKSEFPW